MNNERINKINSLFEKYYNSDDSFEHVDLSIELIQEHIEWLVGQAKKVDILQKQLDAKLAFVNNGWEEERYSMQDKIERYEKAMELARESVFETDYASAIKILEKELNT